jgi:hypothetical protein
MFSLVIYPGSTPVGNATLVVANVLTCNKYSLICAACRAASTVWLLSLLQQLLVLLQG